jgi:hypothetical protein
LKAGMIKKQMQEMAEQDEQQQEDE